MARTARRTSRSRAREEALAAARAVRVPRAADVAVVGGGASGLAAAVAAAEAGAHVVALERDVAFGRRLLATGNGRCNLANARLAWGRYNDAAFVEAVCGTPEGFLADVLAFFEGCGLAVAEEGGGRIYPLSRQASSVREVLLARARRAGVVMAAAREVTGIAQGEVSFDEDGRRISVSAGAVVVAAGGVIGFIGFIVPHIIRILVGADHRRVFPLSFIGGSLFLLWMDVLARTIMAPKELAVGIFTAFCGGPFFVWLLYRKNKYGRM